MNIKKSKYDLFRLVITLAFALFFGLFSFKPAYAEDSVGITIDTPSNSQLAIAPQRSFYVLGSFQGQVPEDSHMVVGLYKDNILVRKIYASKKDDKENLKLDYSDLKFYGSETELKNCCMPDLVYNKSNESSFYDTFRKCYFDGQNFGAVVYNAYESDTSDYGEHVNPNDQFGNKIEPLDAGVYEIRATLANPKNKKIAQESKEITIGDTGNTVLSRFSPDSHFEAVSKWAQGNSYQMLLDAFPGYWSAKSHFKSQSNNSVFCEIPSQWRRADSSQYAQTCSRFCIYNVSETSATYSVEVGKLQYDKAIQDSGRIKYYCYDIGEPSLPSVGDSKTSQKGEITELSDSCYIHLTRIDLPEGESEDGVSDISTLENVKSITNLSDPIHIKANQKLSVYGICKPIQNNSVLSNRDGTFSFDNTIQSIKYGIKVNNSQYTWEHRKTGLVRYYPASSFSSTISQLDLFRDSLLGGNLAKENPSILEFKHDFCFDDSYRGKTVYLDSFPEDNVGMLSGNNNRITLYID